VKPGRTLQYILLPGNMNNNLHNAKEIKKPVLYGGVLSSFLIVLFVYTSLNKIIDHNLFKTVLQSAPLLHNVAGVIAGILPVIELVIALLLFIPVTRLKGFCLSFFLLLLFTVYLVYMVVTTPNLPCNCGGVLKNLTWRQHIFFNLFFMLVSLAGIFLHRKAGDTLSSPPP